MYVFLTYRLHINVRYLLDLNLNKTCVFMHLIARMCIWMRMSLRKQKEQCHLKKSSLFFSLCVIFTSWYTIIHPEKKSDAKVSIKAYKKADISQFEQKTFSPGVIGLMNITYPRAKWAKRNFPSIRLWERLAPGFWLSPEVKK